MVPMGTLARLLRELLPMNTIIPAAILIAGTTLLIVLKRMPPLPPKHTDTDVTGRCKDDP